MITVRLINVPDHTYQTQHAQRLGIKLYSYVPSMIDISVFDHTFQFQHVYRLGIANY